MLAPASVGDLLHMLGMTQCSLHKLVKIIHLLTLQPEIKYSVFTLTADCSKVKVKDEHLPMGLEEFLLRHIATLKDHQWAMVFCRSKADALLLASLLECQSYTADLQVNECTAMLKIWNGGIPSKAITCTTALLAGFDASAIALIVHYGDPYNLWDFDQIGGRAGHNGEDANYLVLMDGSCNARENGESNLGVNEMKQYLTTEQCCRLIWGLVLDGLSKKCLEIGNVHLCDMCEVEVQGTSKVSQVYWDNGEVY